MMRLVRTSLVCAAAWALFSCSSSKPCSAPAPPPGAVPVAAAPVAAPGTAPAGAVAATATISGKVVRVEPKRRVVTLEMADGRHLTVRAHASVKDLEKLKPGDVVAATYYESVAYDVKKAGAAKPGFKVAEASDVQPGTIPAAGDARAVTVTARVNTVDQTAGTLTLAAADAHPVTVRVKDPRLLADIKGGDLVQITYTEAIAVAIEPPH